MKLLGLVERCGHHLHNHIVDKVKSSVNNKSELHFEEKSVSLSIER